MTRFFQCASLACMALAMSSSAAWSQRPTLSFKPGIGGFRRECVGGPNDGLACTETADCERDGTGGLFPACQRFCDGGQNDGQACEIGVDDCLGGGICAQQCFCNYIGRPLSGFIPGDVFVSDWSQALRGWQVSIDLAGMCDTINPIGWDAVTETGCSSDTDCPSEAPFCHVDRNGLPIVCVTRENADLGVFMDDTRDDYIFLGRDSIFRSASFAPDLVQYLDTLFVPPFVEDQSVPKYLLTVNLRAKAGACGNITLPLLGAPQSQVLDEFGFPIEPLDVVTVTVELPACSCTQIVAADSEPQNCAVDARQSTQPDGTAIAGWSSAVLGLDCVDSMALTTCHFAVRTVPLVQASTRPEAVSHNDPEPGWLTLQFPPIPPGVWTCLDYNDSQHCLGYLPADSDGDGLSQAADVMYLTDCLINPELCAPNQCDVDRSGVCGPADLLREVDLLQGAEQFEAWAGRMLPECPSLP